MKRLILIFTVVVMIVVLAAVPAMATGVELLDYNDFVSAEYVDGNYDVVTVRFPSSYCYIGIWNSALQGFQYSGYGSTLSYPASPSNSYAPLIYPFGHSTDRRLSVENIPSDSIVTFEFRIWADSAGAGINSGELSIRKIFYDANGNRIAEDTDDRGKWEGNNTTYSLGLSIPEGASSVSLQLEIWYLTPAYSTSTVYVSLEQFSLSMSVSSLYRLREETKKQNALLDELERQQQETNDKLDGITGYDPVPERPGWQDSVDDLEDVEQDAIENVQTGMDEAGQIFDSVLVTLGQYIGAFAGLAVLFNTFADIPFFAALLAVSLSLGIVAAILGIGIDAARSSARASARSSKNAKKARSG